MGVRVLTASWSCSDDDTIVQPTVPRSAWAEQCIAPALVLLLPGVQAATVRANSECRGDTGVQGD